VWRKGDPVAIEIKGSEMAKALVVGAGPAGLMAADVLSAAGHHVTVAEAKPSPARKLLMAGKSGLNLTKAEAPDAFRRTYEDAAPPLAQMLDQFGPDQVQAWAKDLGQSCFVGSTGRVFPVAMKASPLLRAWLKRLEVQGVDLRRNWRWTGFHQTEILFETPPQRFHADVTVLALGGASWSRLGSDGQWVSALAELKTPLVPFAPSNSAISLEWSPYMSRHFGTPLKSIRLTSGPRKSRGEIVITSRGLEGGGLYSLTPALRNGAPIVIDFVPDRAVADITSQLEKMPKKKSLSNRLRRLGISTAALAIVNEAGPLPKSTHDVVKRLKAATLPSYTLRPIDEAISTAGGVSWDAVNDQLMLHTRPGTFVAGEMLDWEAPTGGYLLTACLATGLWAGQAAVAWLAQQPNKTS
jgi:uncharacterized flavoprotein (TIGR03862 family)